MKKLNYLLKYSFLAITLMTFMTSCEDDESAQFEGPHFASFLGLDSSVLIPENGDAVSVEFGVTEPQSQDVTITLTLIEDTAIQGTHYTISATTITIPAGQYNGSITITPIDDDFFNESRTFTLEITDVTSGNLRIGNFDEPSYFRTVVLTNDDCPTQSNIWWGPLTVQDVGYADIPGCTGSSNADGDCDILSITGDLGAFGPVETFDFFLTPAFDGATSGTVDVPEQLYCSGCSAGLDVVYSATGTYDEGTQQIVVFYDVRRSDGAGYTGTNIIEPAD